MAAQCRPLGDGRLHFQHGPMDIIIGAEGEAEALRLAHAQAWQRFQGLLDELVADLPALRRPVDGPCELRGPVARRMWEAAHVHRPSYVTPMVAVAGAVAQELVSAYARPGIARAWVNNGGDIALHLTPGSSFRIGLYADIDRLAWLDARDGLPVDGVFTVEHDSSVRGVATSGWRGRSFSLGVADSVTVLAATAAGADAAATLIANAVNVDAPGIVRVPAWQLKDDSDLGDIPVTLDVPALTPWQVAHALQAGREHALALQDAGQIQSCVITCQGWVASTEQAMQAHRLPDRSIRHGIGATRTLEERT
ncbi:MAG: UPF0280 family protein [Burkholderiaceae bacterium]